MYVTLGQTSKSVFNNWLRLIQLCVCMIVIVSCSSSEPSKEPRSSRTNKPQRHDQLREVDPIYNSEYFLNRADELGLIEGRPYRITAAELAIQENHSIGYIKKILFNIDLDARGTLDNDITLIKLLLYIKSNQDAERLLIRLKRGVLPINYQVPMWLLTAQVSSNNNQHAKTVRTLFRVKDLYAKRLSAFDKILANELIWKHIVQVPEDSLNQFVKDFGSEAASWVQLAKIVRNNIGAPEQFPIELARWHTNYSRFDDFEYLPQQIKDLISVAPYSPTRIALLLPLTGSLSTQAQAIRNGFLANLNFDDNVEVTILDTEIETLASIEQKLVENRIGFIVGPLKKDKITEFQKSEVLSNIPTLYLNSIELEQYDNPSQFYFSLAPEDEIDQAVDYFISKKIAYPALIYADNSLGRRLAEQFKQQWLFQTDKEIETIAFKNKSKLGVAVKNLLDVNYSEQRVREMKRLFGIHLKTESRSRNDIDAIYVIANSQQTRLIKPFFDTNVSVFNKLLPIYASSRSYLIGETRSQKRDLNGLTFTEMPWLVENTNKEATSIYRQVSEDQTQLKKLFAFGYDAKYLIPLLKQLQTLPDLKVTGLTGKLSLTKQNTIKRYLDWSRYQQGKIVVLKQLN